MWSVYPLSGGAGGDTFVLNVDDATDTITDFEVGIDILRLTQNGQVAHRRCLLVR